MAIELAALNLGTFDSVTYTITVDGGSAVSVDSSTYEVTAGDPSLVRYVAPCDATSGFTNTITVAVSDIVVGGVSLPVSARPPAQTRTDVSCTANQSSAQSFQFYALASSQQGFFDVVLGTELVYCSAKLDCSNDSTFFDGGDGVVLGFACSASAEAAADTVLHMDDITISCDDGATVTSVVIDPTGPGNLAAGTAYTDPSGYLGLVTVFKGEQTNASNIDNVYWNVAIELKGPALAEDCTLTTNAGVSDGVSMPLGGAYINWDVDLTSSATSVTCTSHVLYGASSGVTAAWPTPTTAKSFDNTYDPSP
ncbi:MAG: hypothetical protein H6745_20100 [Deltaproteobacteria bacterium]|nr:hypothetical protein [Deltaproteobacteria bacterium]